MVETISHTLTTHLCTSLYDINLNSFEDISFIRDQTFANPMGGAKKPTAAKSDKSSKESKKKKDKRDSGSKKAEITVQVNESQATKIVAGAKVITVQELARQLGVKISAANAFLLGEFTKGTVKRVGGYSGHYLYQSA